MADPPLPISRCWFGSNKPSVQEIKPRCGSFDLSELDCCKNKRTIGEALSTYKGNLNNFGFANALSLILFRSNGEIDYDENEAMEREICDSHFDSLYAKWNKKHLNRSRKGAKSGNLCSLPSSYHLKSRPTATTVLHKEQAIKWLNSFGELIHPGIAVCLTHYKMLNSACVIDAQSDPINMELNNFDHDFADFHSNPDSDGECDVSNDKSSLIILITSICQIIGISRLITSDGAWEKLNDDTKTRKRKAFGTLMTEMAKVIAGSYYEDLMGVTDKSKSRIDTGDHYLHAIAAAHSNSKCRKEKLKLISILLSVKGICQKKIRGMLSITRHQVRKAVAYCQGLYKFEIHRRVKVSRDKISTFVSYLARSNLIATLPFGDCVAKLSDGTTLNIASITRLFSYSQIIREYFKELQRSGNWAMKLSRTTLYHILRAIARRKNKQLYCVDEYLGEALDAFEKLDSVMNKWQEYGKMSSEERTTFKQGLRVVKSFLETDYRSHVQSTSNVASHCIQHSLSDKGDPKFATNCLHPHDLICTQCERVDSVLHTLVEKARHIQGQAKSSRDPNLVELKRLFEMTSLASSTIHKYRRHLLRCAASDSVRFDIQSGLEENECLLTIDFAMKLLASSALETQSGFYAKKGVSFHISHALIRKDSNMAHHVFAHVIQTGDQDCETVCAILRHVMEELKRLGIQKVSIRSDNACTYKSAAVLATLQSIASSVPMIVRYAFTETQYGKGPCDRASAYMKRTIKSWNEALNDSVTAKQFFAALTSNTPRGCSIYLVDVTKKNPPIAKKKTTINGISSFFEFRFATNGLIANKYANIGPGLAINSSSLPPSETVLKVDKQGGFLDSPDCWVVLKERKGDIEEEDVEDITEENPYQCTTKQCTKSFLTVEELEDHIYKQDHSFAKIKETLLDLAKREISVAVETQEAARIAVEESELILNRSDKLTHEQGWAIKEPRGPRMNKGVQQFAEKFFLDHRVEGKRACPAECSELIRTEKNSDGTYRFALSICPSEKTLTSSFGNWEAKRLRPKAVATRGAGRRTKKAVPYKPSTSTSKRYYESTDEEDNVVDEQDIDEEEEEEEEKIDDEHIIASLIEEISNEIFVVT